MFIRINLDKVLAKRRMTAYELSERIGVPETSLSMLKKSIMRDPRFRIIEKICNELQVSPEDILNFEKENKYNLKIA